MYFYIQSHCGPFMRSKGLVNKWLKVKSWLFNKFFSSFNTSGQILREKRSSRKACWYFFLSFSLTQLSSGKHRARTPVPWNTTYLGDQQLLLKSLKLKILYLEPTAVESLRSSPIQRNLPTYWTSRGVYSARYRCSSLTSMPSWKR